MNLLQGVKLPRRSGFTVTSTTSLTVPEGVYQMEVSLVGGGGGALLFVDMTYSYDTAQWTTHYNFAGGGAGGYYWRYPINVQPGDIIDIEIGSGGATRSGYYNVPHIGTPTTANERADDGGHTRLLINGTVVLTAYGGEGGRRRANAGDGGYPNGSGGGCRGGYPDGGRAGGCGTYTGNIKSVGSWAGGIFYTTNGAAMGTGPYPGCQGSGGRSPFPMINGVEPGQGGDFLNPVRSGTRNAYTYTTDQTVRARPGRPGAAIIEWVQS